MSEGGGPDGDFPTLERRRRLTACCRAGAALATVLTWAIRPTVILPF